MTSTNVAMAVKLNGGRCITIVVNMVGLMIWLGSALTIRIPRVVVLKII